MNNYHAHIINHQADMMREQAKNLTAHAAAAALLARVMTEPEGDVE